MINMIIWYILIGLLFCILAWISEGPPTYWTQPIMLIITWPIYIFILIIDIIVYIIESIIIRIKR